MAGKRYRGNLGPLRRTDPERRGQRKTAVRFTEEIEAYATFRLQVNARADRARVSAATTKNGHPRRRNSGQWQTSRRWPHTKSEATRSRDHRNSISCLTAPGEGSACEATRRETMPSPFSTSNSSDELLRGGHERGTSCARSSRRAKEAGLHVSDRIALYLDLPQDFLPGVGGSLSSDYVTEQTLAHGESRPLEEILARSSTVHEAQVRGTPRFRIGVRRSGD